VAEILFDKIARQIELLVKTPNGESQRGRLNLTRIYSENSDFMLQGMGVSSNQEHRFALSMVTEIIDVESGENVDIIEFRAELAAHPKS